MPSENGWNPSRANGATDCEWVRIPGAEHVSLQFLKGWPSAVLRAYAADYHAYVEPLRDADSAAYTPTNSVATSNHLNGTAMDLNWNSHPFKIDYAGFDAAKIARMRDLLAFYNFEGLQIVFWAQDWRTPKDAMHHQMGYNTWNNPIVGRFIEQRIRPDGFSTYKRGGTSAPLPPPANTAAILARATGLTTSRASQILPAVTAGLQQSQCTTVPRIAMWLAQCGHESAGFDATEEYQNGDANTERWKYKGRTWIQLTWRSAYEGFGKWCYARGLVTDPNVFVNNPKSLADLKWAGLGAAYYWTTTVRNSRKYPTLNQASDARDVLVATQIINGGTNGLTDRQGRYNRALSVGDDLLALVSQPPSDPLEALLMADLAAASWSIYSNPGEPDVKIIDMIRAIDAKEHRDLTEADAREGDPEAIRRVARTAAGKGRYPTPGAIARASRILNEINAVHPEFIVAATPGRS